MNFEQFLDKYQKVPVEEYPNQVTENPVVSVCVQTYQHVSYIRKCLDGILMQETDIPFEILIGEDASSDGTREICIEYAKNYPHKIRLFLHHRENNINIFGSPTGRFNFLYNLYSANGEYIAICEGDDYWIDPTKLKTQISLLKNFNLIELCFHPSYKMRGYKKQGLAGDCGKSMKVIPTERILQESDAVCPMQSIVFRNKSIDRFVSGLSTTIGGHWHLQAFYSIPNGALYSPKPMAVYRIASDTSIVKNVILTKDAFLKHMLIKINETEHLLSIYGSKYHLELHNRKIKLLSKIMKSHLVTIADKIRIARNTKEDYALLYKFIIIGELKKLKYLFKSI